MIETSEKKSTLIAAALIMSGAASGYFFMPALLKWLAETSVWLSYGVAILFVLMFFGVFWLRSRYQGARYQE